MPAILAPTTRSPGKLVILYRNTLLTHQMAVNYTSAVDMTDLASHRTRAASLATVLQPVLPTTETIYAWRILDPNGVRLYEEAFTTAFVGTHVAATGNTAAYSLSLTIPCNGTPTPITAGSGNTLVRFFTRTAYTPVPGSKYLATPFDTAMLNLIALLAGSAPYPADFYGQKAIPVGVVAVQYNAAVQKRWGS